MRERLLVAVLLAAAAWAEPLKYRWVLQCIYTPNQMRQSYVNDSAIVPKPLPLPQGALILSVFPENREFELQGSQGRRLPYKNGKLAKGQRIPPGAWQVFTRDHGGIAVFLK